MPRGDGTGPLGYGPRSGRGFGFCSGFTAPGWIQGGYGSRWGCQQYTPYYHPAYPMYAPESQEHALKQQAEFLEAQLNEVRTRLNSFPKKDK